MMSSSQEARSAKQHLEAHVLNSSGVGEKKYKRHRKGGHKSLQKILGSDINQQQLFSSNIASEHFLFVALKSALANGI